MPAPVFTDADFARALGSLLPRGRVWPREIDTAQARVVAGLAPTFRRSAARAAQLLVDAFPPTTDELLPEWEASLGLPDPCAGPQPTVQLRRAQVAARLTSIGSQSVPYMVSLAAALGYAVTITQFAPFVVGRDRTGQPLNGETWAHAWQVNAPTNTVRSFRTGASAAGEALRSWGNAVLECELRAVAPAHTTAIFAYS